MTTSTHGFFLVLPLWLISLWRLPDAWRPSPSRRRMWATFVMLATALTSNLPPISHALGRLTGRTDTSTLVMHLSVTVSSYLLMGWIHATGAIGAGTPPRWWHALLRTRVRRSLLLACFALQTALFPFSVQVADTQHFNQAQDGHLLGSLHVALCEGYIAVAVSLAALMCAEIHRLDRRGLLGICMGVMSVGCWLGVGYTLTQIFFNLTPVHPDLADRYQTLYTAATRGFADTGIGLIILGTSVRAFEGVRQVFVRHALVVGLRPLWTELSPALDPRVVASAPGRRRERLSLGRSRSALAERWLQIRDAAVVLTGWVPEGLRRRAGTAVAELGVPAAERDATVAAYCLRAALARLDAGTGSPSSSTEALLAADSDHVEGARWLLLVSAAYFGPLMRRLDAQLNDHPDTLAATTVPTPATTTTESA